MQPIRKPGRQRVAEFHPMRAQRGARGPAGNPRWSAEEAAFWRVFYAENGVTDQELGRRLHLSEDHVRRIFSLLKGLGPAQLTALRAPNESPARWQPSVLLGSPQGAMLPWLSSSLVGSRTPCSEEEKKEAEAGRRPIRLNAPTRVAVNTDRFVVHVHDLTDDIARSPLVPHALNEPAVLALRAYGWRDGRRRKAMDAEVEDQDVDDFDPESDVSSRAPAPPSLAPASVYATFAGVAPIPDVPLSYATAAPELPCVVFTVFDAAGRATRLMARTSPFEFALFRPPNLPYRRHIEIISVDHGYDVVGLLSFDRRTAFCPKCRWRRGDHVLMDCHHAARGERCPSWHYESICPPRRSCGRCGWSAKLHWKCPACRALNQCDACDALTALRPLMRFEVTGGGCELGLLVPLLQTFVAPYAHPDGLEADDHHIAVDAEMTHATAVVAPTTVFRSVQSYWNGADTAPGVKYGSEERCLVAYDKRAEVRAAARSGDDPGAREHPSTLDFAAVTRFEFRQRPPKHLGLEPLLESLSAKPFWKGVVVADLRDATPGTLSTELALMAKRHPVLAVKPLRARAERQVRVIALPPWERRGRGMPLDLGSYALSQLATSGSRSAQQIAETLCTASATAVRELARQGGIDLGVVVDRELPRLVEDIHRGLTEQGTAVRIERESKLRLKGARPRAVSRPVVAAVDAREPPPSQTDPFASIADLDKRADVRWMLADWDHWRSQTKHVQRAREPWAKKPRKATPARVALLSETRDWCVARGLDPRRWIFTLFDARRFDYPPKMRAGDLMSERLVRYYEMARHLGYLSNRLLQTKPVPVDGYVDAQRDTIYAVEGLKERYAASDQRVRCMTESLTRTLGYHPKSKVCATCPVALQCAERLALTHDFDIIALRKGKISLDEVRARSAEPYVFQFARFVVEQERTRQRLNVLRDEAREVLASAHVEALVADARIEHVGHGTEVGALSTQDRWLRGDRDGELGACDGGGSPPTASALGESARSVGDDGPPVQQPPLNASNVANPRISGLPPPWWENPAIVAEVERRRREEPWLPAPLLREQPPHAILPAEAISDGATTTEAQAGHSHASRSGELGGRDGGARAPSLPGGELGRFVSRRPMVGTARGGGGDVARSDGHVSGPAPAPRARRADDGVWKGTVIEERDEARPVLGAGGDPRGSPQRERGGVPEAPRRRVRRAVTLDGL